MSGPHDGAACSRAAVSRTAIREFLRFGLIGAAGFFVDAGVLTLSMKALGLGLYAGRVVSYLCAATFTWICNRRFTFTTADRSAPAKQWLRFLGANAIGGLVNYGVYALVVTFTQTGAAWPVLGVAAGSVAGLAFNFTVSKLWVFKG